MTKLYTSLKEITIFEDMSQSQNLKNCTKGNGVDIGEDVSDEKLNAVSECFLGGASKEELLDIEKKLGLKNLRLIRDRKAPLIKEYLEKRLMEGLYGDYSLNTTPELGANGKHKVVKQDVFLKLYRNQVINNLYISQAKFCLKDQATDPKATSEVRKIIDGLEKLAQTDSLQTVWNDCQKKIMNTECNNLSSNSVKLDWDSEDYKKSVCSLKKRIREYRLVLETLDESIKELNQVGASMYGFEVEGVENYTGKNDGEKKIQEMATLTSYDSYLAFEKENPQFFDDNLSDFEQYCNLNNLNPNECAEHVNQKDMENFNKLKISVMSEFNNKKNNLKKMNKNELLESVEAKLLTDKERKMLADLTSENDIRKALDGMLENYKVALVHELNEKLKAKMASSRPLSSTNALDEIRFGIENDKKAMMGLTQFTNTVLQYQTIIDANTKVKLGNNSLPIQMELEGMGNYVSDKSAHRWIRNTSKKSVNSDSNTVFEPNEDFFDKLFIAK